MPGKVVYYNPDVDVAVIAVPTGTVRPLRFASGTPPPVTGWRSSAIPQNGPYNVQVGRVRADQRLRSPDIYGDGTVIRDVLSLRGLIRPGNSGGPVVDSAGHVVGVVFAASVTSGDTGYALSAAAGRPGRGLRPDRVAPGVDPGLRGVRTERSSLSSLLRICLASWACAIAFSGARDLLHLAYADEAEERGDAGGRRRTRSGTPTCRARPSPFQLMK